MIVQPGSMRCAALVSSVIQRTSLKQHTTIRPILFRLFSYQSQSLDEELIGQVHARAVKRFQNRAGSRDHPLTLRAQHDPHCADDCDAMCACALAALGIVKDGTLRVLESMCNHL